MSAPANPMEQLIQNAVTEAVRVAVREEVTKALDERFPRISNTTNDQ